MANILVTGANGFIGQHLCRELLKNNHSVRGLFHEEKPLYFINDKEIEWFQADLKHPNTLTNCAENIDIIIHLSAIPRNDISKSWDEFKAINIIGTIALLEEASKSRVKRFVFISTVEAAGFGDGINPRKESDLSKPANNYGKSKLEAEKIVMSEKWNMECVTLRLPMIYGPGTFLIVPKLFGMVEKGFYPLIGSGNTLMEFCYVGNAVNAIILASEHQNAAGQIFYVSDERSYSIKDVVVAISKAMNKKVFFLYLPTWIAYLLASSFELLAKLVPVSPIVSKVSKKPFFTRETVWWTTRNVNIVDITKIKNLLEYTPPYSIEDGCKKTVKWLREMAQISVKND